MTAPHLTRPAGVAASRVAPARRVTPASGHMSASAAWISAAPRRRPQPQHIAAPGERPRPAVAARRRDVRRPAGAPLAHTRPGVRVSRASHRRRITPRATVGLSLLAALITVWLGAVAQFGAAADSAASSAVAPVSAGQHRLAIVEVGHGETLEHLAARVAPQTPTAQVVARIRELNALPTTALAAGQTLVTPVD